MCTRFDAQARFGRIITNDHRHVRRFIQIMILLVLLAGGGGAWYLSHRGFSKSWREWIVRELRERGAEISFSRLTLEPFRGLVARDVKVYEGPERKRVVARVDEMVIEANYALAVRREPFVEALTLVDASAQLPYDAQNPSGPFVQIQKLNTRILLTQDKLLVSRMEAEFGGIRITAAGQFTGTTTFVFPEKTSEERPLILSQIAYELEQLRHEGEKTRLDIRFSGDLAHPQTIVVEADLSAEKLRRANYRIESANISALWKDGMITLPRFDLRDSVGRLQLSASFDPKARHIDAYLRSGMDLPALLRAFDVIPGNGATANSDPADLKFQSIPQVELTGRVSLAAAEPVFKVFGRVSVGAFQYGRVLFDRFHADVSWDGRRWAVRDFALRQRQGGELKGNVQQDFDESGTGDFRLDLTSTLNPEALAPIIARMGQAAADRLGQMRFPDAPKITLSARGPSALDSVASGDLTLGRAVYRGMEALGARANLRYNGRTLYVDDFLLRRAEGIAGGALAFNFPARTVTISKVRAAVHPQEVMVWIDPTLIPDLKPYRFGRKPPEILVDGTVDKNSPPIRTNLNFVVDAPAMTYEFKGKDLHFDRVSAKLGLKGYELSIQDGRAELFGGTVKGDATISVAKANPGHTAAIKLTDVDFTSLAKLYFDYEESHGKLNGTFRFTGVKDDARRMQGEGEMTVTEGNVFAIPFLGPLSELLAKLIPGFGYQKARRGSASFTVADGIVSTKNFLVEGRGFSMIGDGRLWLTEDKMDFDMRINAQGLPGLLLFPVSKLLEVRSSSKLTKPEWRPKVIPTLPGGKRPAEPKATRPKIIGDENAAKRP